MLSQLTLPHAQRRYHLVRFIWWTLAAGYLALLLISLPNFYTRVSTQTIEPYTLGERVIYDNARAQKDALERGVSLESSAAIEVTVVMIQVVIYYLLTSLIIWRTTNGFGWFTAYVLLMLCIGRILGVIVEVAQPFPFASIFVLIPSYLVWPAWVLWIYLFPNGQAVPRYTFRPVIFFFSVFMGGQILSLLDVLEILPSQIDIFFATIGPLLVLPVFGFVLYAQVYRYRHLSNKVERQQTKWFLFAIGIFFAVSMGFAMIPEPVRDSVIAQNVFGIIFMIFPLAIALAILRYRLFDIDLIIRRTLQYSILTGLLALVYFGSVVLLQAVVGRGADAQSPLVIVLSTLLISALFAPLRQRVQALIDRRFYRQKYDAAQALARFARTARDETDIERLIAELNSVVEQTLQPEHTGVWLQSVRRDRE
jgi:hypothetical protein